jgi:multicomponent Na+:H+ antiporter subunit D
MMELPLGILWFGAVIVALLDGTRHRNAVLSIVILASALVSTLVLGADVYRNGTQEMVVGGWEQGVGISLRIDTLGIIFAVLSQAVLLAALVFETANGIKARIFPALVLFMGLGLTGVFFTGDAFNFYVFFEIAMISAYVLASYGETPRQFRSAFIFIVVNLLGSMLFLISIAALYHTTGRLDMVGIKAQVPLVAESPIVLISATIFVAFGVKLGLFPFHFWLPAVYTGTRVIWVDSVRRGCAAPRARVRGPSAANPRRGEHRLWRRSVDLPALRQRGAGLFVDRSGGVHHGRSGYRR